ncbi:WhiB family transcriptional regulator [Amycolatopsis thermoflava]|uniref:WhiB family transcriptional regulator n=1 Tax=Amycolatopsis thermoflava TaxID=84480 RepID=UPI0004035472|nr:WhiB family transcriptional regulator [Amycolatopsis thermoflava]
MTPDDYAPIAKRLDRFAPVSDEVLADIVTHEGLCFWVFNRDEMPDLSGETEPDRELAAWSCAGCPVVNSCLELELRVAGEQTVGVWGGLADTDRRKVHRFWQWRRQHPQGGAR